MKTYRIGVIGLGQRIAHVLAAMQEVGWSLEVAGHADPAPVGLPILERNGIAPGPRLRHAGRADRRRALRPADDRHAQPPAF
jgi:predicted dehydrogenase